jgi:hypothetical protein
MDTKVSIVLVNVALASFKQLKSKIRVYSQFNSTLHFDYGLAVASQNKVTFMLS